MGLLFSSDCHLLFDLEGQHWQNVITECWIHNIVSSHILGLVYICTAPKMSIAYIRGVWLWPEQNIGESQRIFFLVSLVINEAMIPFDWYTTIKFTNTKEILGLAIYHAIPRCRPVKQWHCHTHCASATTLLSHHWLRYTHNTTHSNSHKGKIPEHSINSQVWKLII